FGLHLIDSGTQDFFAVNPEVNLGTHRQLMELEAAVMDTVFFMVTGRSTSLFSDKVTALKNLPIRTVSRIRKAQQEALL
ncbi:MAG: hypothetical protein ACTS5I_10005, partial [Rhodanobacter sp.]